MSGPLSRSMRAVARAALLASILARAAEPVGAAWAADRVALAVGNGAYERTARLRNPVNDATDIAAALRRLGFETVLATDVGVDGFDDRLAEFEEAAAGASVSLFFYAGHGLQMDGVNYLVPVDARLERRQDLRRRAVALDDVTDVMRARVNLVFLDACRNNTLARSLEGTRAATRGLARVERTDGMLVAYATEPGGVAEDGSGRNSPWTAALLEHIGTPGLSVDDMLSEAAGTVRARTGGRQRPWKDSSLASVFRFVPGGLPLPGGRDTARLEAEIVFWESIAGSAAPAEFEAYLAEYPEGRFARLARARLRALDAAAWAEAGSRDTAAAWGRYLSAWPRGRHAAEARRRQAAAEKRERGPSVGDMFRDCANCPEMVVVPAGRFIMGSPPSEEYRWRDDDERPQRRVTIPAPFAVGVSEVTRGEFARFAGANRWDTGDICLVWRATGYSYVGRSENWRSPGFTQTDDHPAVCVNWDDAQAYVGWLSRETGHEYRLLSESEWEYAARAGTATARFWGESDARQCAYANGADASTWITYAAECNDGHAQTSPAGRFRVNGWGIRDMIGNAAEWVEDCWHRSYADAPSDARAWLREGGGDCSHRVVRGGSWRSYSSDLRSASRDEKHSRSRANFTGFRVARSISP